MTAKRSEPISQDPKTQSQVAGIIARRDAELIANGESPNTLHSLTPDEAIVLQEYRIEKKFEERSGRQQIDGWKAIAFASDHHNIDDHYDRLEFLNDVLENDMTSIAERWPEFVEFCGRAP